MAKIRSRWIAFTAFLCLLMVATTLIASTRPRRTDYVLERDGFRIENRRTMGLFSNSRSVMDPSLHVSADFQKELVRLGLKLPARILHMTSYVSRQRLTNVQVRYSFTGDYSGTPKDILDQFAVQLPHATRMTTAANDQLYGTCSDGRSQIDVSSGSSGGQSWVSLGLMIPK